MTALKTWTVLDTILSVSALILFLLLDCFYKIVRFKECEKSSAMS